MIDRIELDFRLIGRVTEITLPVDFGENPNLVLLFEAMLARAAGGFTAQKTFGAWLDPVSERIERADVGQVTYRASGLADDDFREILRFILSETQDRAVYVVRDDLGHMVARRKPARLRYNETPDLDL